MGDAVIVSAVRSPVGRIRGVFREQHPVELSAHVLRAAVSAARIAPEQVDDVVWGCVSQAGEQAGNIGRSAVLAAGWPESVPATTVDRQCGSSQQSVEFAASLVMSGLREVVVAGGVESMTRVPMGSARMDVTSPLGPAIKRRYGRKRFNQGWGADEIARQAGIGRERLDAYAVESHQRAAAATDANAFADQIVPTPGLDKEGNAVQVTEDEGIRRNTSLTALAALQPAFGEDGLHTAGSSSQMSDGAAALVITSADYADRYGLVPLARVRTSVVVGVDPVTMLTGPIPATERVLKRAGLTIEDIDTFEINEAFASIVLSWADAVGAPVNRVNSDGGAIALGHPLGGSGARLMATMIHRMRRDGLRFGLQSMCEGGGMANATILELIR